MSGSRHAEGGATGRWLATSTEDLTRLVAQADRRLRSRGLASLGRDTGGGRHLHPSPLVIDPVDWSGLETGIIQRVRLLAALADDLYGPDPRTIGTVLPPEVVWGNPAFATALAGWAPRHGRRLTFAALDVQATTGTGGGARWALLEEHLCVPTGLEMALENREITMELRARDYAEHRVRRLDPFLAALRRGLEDLVAPDSAQPRIVMVSPGRDHPAHVGVSELARTLGYTVAEGADLSVRRGRLFLGSLAGLEPVDVLVRFTGDDRVDPLELGAGGAGIPALTAAVRNGAVTVANALGSALLESPVLAAFDEALCTYLLGEPLALPTVATWWCGHDEGLAVALDAVDELVFRPIDPGQAAVDTARLDESGRAELRARVTRQPWWWTVRHRAGPGAGPELRLFATAEGTDVTVLPGGVAHLAGTGRSGRADLSADVWVTRPEGVAPRAVAVRVSGLAQVDFATSLPSRAGEAMFWVGRSLERIEALARLCRTVLDRGEQSEALQPAAWFLAIACALDRLTGAAEPSATGSVAVAGALTDRDRDRGLPRLSEQLLTGVSSVRELLSAELWDQIELVRTNAEKLGSLAVADAPAVAGEHLDSLGGALSAISGVIAESTFRGPGWYLLDAGRRLERLAGLVTVLDATLGGRRPDDIAEELLECLLVANASLIAYRRRHRSDLELDTVLATVMVDPSNPRSMRRAVSALVEDLEQLPRPARVGGREETVALAHELADLLDRLEPAVLGRLGTEADGGFAPAMSGLGSGAAAIAGALADVYLHHVQVAQLPTPVDTSTAGRWRGGQGRGGRAARGEARRR